MGDYMFERNISLIGNEKFNNIKNTKVLIVGCGGVGGYALETLVRSGVKYITIIDSDKIDITNLNRQIITNIENVGNVKVEEAKKRALSINKDINIDTYQMFLTKENIKEIVSNKYEYIIDACDTVDTKVELIKHCIQNNIKLISSMGTAKKMHSTKLEITTLDKTNYDPLAKVIRKRIKDLKLNPKKINVVSSTESIIKNEHLGSFMMVPAVAGILCVEYIINDIINK